MNRPTHVEVGSILVASTFLAYIVDFYLRVPPQPDLFPPVITILLCIVVYIFAILMVYRAYMGNRAIVFLLCVNVPVLILSALLERSLFMAALVIVYTIGLALLLTPTSREWYASQSSERST